jgi:hypothetical protein
VLPQLAPVALGPVDVFLERYREYLTLEHLKVGRVTVWEASEVICVLDWFNGSGQYRST